MPQLEFKNPYFLLLYMPYVVMVVWFVYRKYYSRRAAIALSSENVIQRRFSLRARTYKFIPLLRFISIALLIAALTRPGKGVHVSSVKNQGIDIMIALDVSQSMSGRDFQPYNRLSVAKSVLKSFIERRKNDRIGLVIFAADAYLQCPLTVERDILGEIVDEVDFYSTSDFNRTAIGDALALGASRMVERKAKSKIIVLITDGESNAGQIDPETAAKACADNNIKVYTVGIGKQDRFNRFSYDPEPLKNIAKITGGKFYQALSSGVLWEQISDIDRLEKSEIEVKTYYEFYDRFTALLVGAIALFFFEILLRSTIYRKVP